LPGSRYRSGVRIEDDRQPVPTVADDHGFRIGRLRKLQRRLDTAPAQIGIGNSLTDVMWIKVTRRMHHPTRMRAARKRRL